MIKAIILDFGNVICSFTNELLIDRISKISGKSKEEVFDLIYKRSGLPKKYETGLLTSKEFYKEMLNLCGLSISYEALKTIYSSDKFTPVKGMEELIKKLHKKYKIGLLSNCSDWDYDYMITSAPIIKTFDTMTKSYEVKAMKPDPKIYLDAVKKLGLNNDECLYFDDILDYVKAAKEVGLEAVQFTTIENFELDLKRFGVGGDF